MKYTLIIAEKPAAARKIADALAEGKPIKENVNGVPYYKLSHGKKDIIVACAVGHLYNLEQLKGKKSDFPIFDIGWKPAYQVRKSSAFSKKYLDVIKKLCKDADSFIVACDYDVEGSLIGANLIKFACKKKDAQRMKFSTLTKSDLVEAYENKMPHIDWGQAEAGETRHYLDFFNGINYSRALTSSIKTAGSFKIMSTGRVQGPALKIIVDREKEIKAFKPVPFWQIELKGRVKEEDIEAWHTRDLFFEGKLINNFIFIKEGEYKFLQKEKEIKKEYKTEQEAKNQFLNFIESIRKKGYKEIKKIQEKNEGSKRHILLIKKNENQIWKKEEADAVIKKTKGSKKGVIDRVEKKQFYQAPPNPFDLTALQVEAYRVFKIQPKETLSIAQEIYTSGYISYPRTSSNQLPPTISYSRILKLLSKQEEYREFCKELLTKKELAPNNGKKTDPAHPAIYSTGEIPSGLKEKEKKIYDLITRRILATFAEAALRETMVVDINVKDEIFIAKGTRTIKKGWHIYYEPYVKLDEIELPKVEKNDIVLIKKITMHEKETQPPRRYTPASIIKTLESKNLGTKATRASIIDTLFQRGYIIGKAIQATELGIRTIGTLEKHCPRIIDEELTRHFEEEMEKIRERKTRSKDVLEEAKGALTKIIEGFKKHEKEIGKELLKAIRETRNFMTTLGKCPVCKKGDLHIRRGKHGYFASCSGYPKCKTIMSLPGNALLKPALKQCATCGYPMITVIKKKKKPQDFCINPKCESKHIAGKAGKEAKAVAKGELEKPCPKCKEGKLVLRKSIYGSFYGCSRFPKCRYTENLHKN